MTNPPTNTRIDRVTTLVLETERLRAEQARIGESIAKKETELSALFTQAPRAAAEAVKASPVAQSTNQRASSRAARVPRAEKVAKTPAGGKPSIKQKILTALGESHAGVELEALAQLAYGLTDAAHKKRCETNLYNLFKKGLVTHVATRWSLADGAPVSPRGAAAGEPTNHNKNNNSTSKRLPRRARKGGAGGGSIKDIVIAMLKAQPAGVDLSVLAEKAYGDTERGHRRLCEKNMYNLAKAGLVKHTGSLWSLVSHAG